MLTLFFFLLKNEIKQESRETDTTQKSTWSSLMSSACPREKNNAFQYSHLFFPSKKISPPGWCRRVLPSFLFFFFLFFWGGGETVHQFLSSSSVITSPKETTKSPDCALGILILSSVESTRVASGKLLSSQTRFRTEFLLDDMPISLPSWCC